MGLHLQLYSRKGLSILEVMAVLAIVGVLLSFVIPVCVDRINRAKYEKMINEMTSIAQASIDYYRSQYPNAWPDSSQWASQLAPEYMFNAVTLNPWGRAYELTTPNSSNNYKNLVIISTNIPPGMVQMIPVGSMIKVVPGVGASDGQAIIALSVPNESTGWLQYENKNLYD